MTDWSKIDKVPDRGPTIGQYEDGTWYWLDETWNYGDDGRYPTRAWAQAQQNKYCAYLEDGHEGVRALMHQLVDSYIDYCVTVTDKFRAITWEQWQRGERP